MEYNPDSAESRQKLASSIIKKLNECGFTLRVEAPGREKVYYREISDGMQVVIYTSIVGNQVRAKDQDAIRISGIYKDEDRERGLIKSTRVNRTGQIEDIVERMYQRMRDTWRRCSGVKRCRSCGAPTFLSRSENQVCVKICWENKS